MTFPIIKEGSGVQVVKALLRFFSYLFHLALGLFLLAVAALALSSSPQSLHLDMLPWTGATLAYTILAGALFGLVSLVLAVTGKLRFLFFVWSLVVAVMLLKGYFFSGYRFSPDGVRLALELLAASLLALVGAWFAMRQPAPGRYR